MSSIPVQVDVLVVGFGPVGAALGCLLGGYGIRTLVIDKAAGILTHPRAISLDHEALRILQLAGLGEGSFRTVPIPIVRLRSPYFGEFGHMNTAGSTDGHPKLVTFYQPELEAALRARLSEHASVTTAPETELCALAPDERGVRAEVADPEGRRTTVQATYVVGADGANSFVRQAIGLGFQGHTYGEDWLIVDALGVREPIDHVEFLCNPERPTPHMVAPGGRQRWEFMLAPGETRESMERPEKIRELLAPWGTPEEMTIERTAVYRFQARVVDAFARGRIFLAGDAAHVTPPFAGQGLVAGLRDAANLAWKLAWVLEGRAGDSILASYDVERRPHAQAMVRLATRMGHLIMPQSRLRAFLSHGIVRLLRLLPAFRVLFDDMKLKPGTHFRRGLFARGKSAACLRRGGLLPQGRLRSPGGEVVWSDDAFGPSLTLVGLGDDPSRHLTPDAAAAFRAAGGRIIGVHARGQTPAAEDGLAQWEDLDGGLLSGTAPAGWVAIVRPDRVVLHHGPAKDVSRLVGEALSLLGAPPGLARPKLEARHPCLPSTEKAAP